MSDQPTDVLQAAVQEFVNASQGEALLVQAAVVIYEAVRIDDDGDMLHRVRYAVAQGSIASAVGLAEIGKVAMLADIGVGVDE